MAKELFYRQCSLERATDTGTVRRVTWIPEKAEGIKIEPGVTLRIKEHGAKEWEDDRWTVASVGEQRHPEKRVKERAHNWQKYRAATDV